MMRFASTLPDCEHCGSTLMENRIEISRRGDAVVRIKAAAVCAVCHAETNIRMERLATLAADTPRFTSMF